MKQGYPFLGGDISACTTQYLNLHQYNDYIRSLYPYLLEHIYFTKTFT
jgi:hypothetical protein